MPGEGDQKEEGERSRGKRTTLGAASSYYSLDLGKTASSPQASYLFLLISEKYTRTPFIAFLGASSD